MNLDRKLTFMQFLAGTGTTSIYIGLSTSNPFGFMLGALLLLAYAKLRLSVEKDLEKVKLLLEKEKETNNLLSETVLDEPLLLMAHNEKLDQLERS